MSKRNKKSSQKIKKLNPSDLQGTILHLLRRHPAKRFNAKQIIRKLKISNNKDSVQDALEKLSGKELIEHIHDGRFRIARNVKLSRRPRPNIHFGYVDATRAGAAFIVCDDLEQDVYVSPRKLNYALNGDRVKVAVRPSRRGKRPEGEIIEVIERSTEHFIGTLHLTHKYGMVVPDRNDVNVDIVIKQEDLNEAKDQDKVVVKILQWHSRSSHNPIGIITSTLGEVGTIDLEMQSILINNGFDLGFSANVLIETKNLSDTITEEDLKERRDMRKIPTFTIDPKDAKDFDDAISVRRTKDGSLEIGVHIADVTHYVKPGSALDKNAAKRSTSVYLVDRVLPMLPERLSNELCSLRPHEDKFTFSAVFILDEEYKVSERWFGKTLTHSDRRFTYEEAQEIIENGEGDFHSELSLLNRIAYALRKKRFANGAISFEADEVQFELDADGKPLSVYTKERKDAHLLIEDFMLLANREVATYIQKKGKQKEIPFVYRIHDTPDPDKLADFALFAKALGIQLNLQTPKSIADSLNKLAKAARENSALKMLEPMAIRTMAKAIYTTENIGHYGLAFENYCHFTSPIRRYADVLVHRIVYNNLEGRNQRKKKEDLEMLCKHISNQERKAKDAERESVKYMQVEYLSAFIGSEFTGQISGFHDKGLFVELIENKCEGMISFNRMPEPFELGSGKLSAKGLRSQDVIHIGDLVQVRITNTDLSKRQIDLDFIKWTKEE